MAKHFEFGCKYCGQVTTNHMVTVDGHRAVRCWACGTCNFDHNDVVAADKRAARTYR